MNLLLYVNQGRGMRSELARALSLLPIQISNWATGRRPVPIEHCPAIERATGGAVTRRDLRPDDWMDIWPELAEPHPADAQTEGAA
jgi:DNA-binding transcriptional regulator YdaS (Cro superfamily)